MALVKAAGIMFLSLNGNVLFLKRAPTYGNDFGEFWDFPGGGQDGDESAEMTARREAREEIGFVPEGDLVYHTRTKGSAASAGSGVAVGPGTATVPPVAAVVPAAPPLPDVDYVTFMQRVTNEFTPELSDEHVGWSWAPVASPPEPLHPGCRIALDRIGMDEVGVARAIADGRLTSPQRYGNGAAGVNLFAIRITGTDIAYRSKHNEIVHRNPDNYLNDEFLARCNGLPVIYKHPKKMMLNSDEFADRVVGSIFLPYIAGDEVWGIAKIYDDGAAREMEEKQLSTSPAVFFHDVSVNTKFSLEDGRNVLIEGKPSLLDHVAICEQGVWDKGGEPTGIRSESREDSAMTPEEEKAAADKAKKDAEEKAAADKKKADAEAGTQLDKTLAKMDAFCDSMSKRMDAIEEREKARDDAAKKRDDDAKKRDDDARKRDDDARKAADAKKRDDANPEDPEKVAADKKKADEDKEKEEKEKAAADARKRDDDAAKKRDDDSKKRDDAAKADADDLRKRIEAMAATMKPISDDDHSALADAWSRADDVFVAFGKATPRAMPGETSMPYRRRVIKALKEHSKTWKDIDLNSQAFADDAAFAVVERQVLAEAAVAARDPSLIPDGGLRTIEKRRDGHIIREFVGQPRAWMNPMAGAVQLKATGSWKTGNLGN